MALKLLDNIFHPDVLSCLADLSNDEVFTPPKIAKEMLDMLPQELFRSPNTKFLDPACKSGIFLREITERLNEGLKDIIPDPQKRIDHILHNQVYGIAITQITALLSRRSVYCSKDASGQYSLSHFDTSDGNIRFKETKHYWENGSCKYCGASKSVQDRGNEKEAHAYEFIHRNIREIANMKFDVIISNPPYQLEDNGNGQSAKPIYHLFVENAKKMNPKYMVMIIPSRWFTGGKGLDNFRKTMLDDSRIRKLIDYENYKDLFPGLGGLAGGACYFLWDRDETGICEITNATNQSKLTDKRYMNEFNVFIRSNRAISIVRKVLKVHNGKFLDEFVSSRKPFGLPTNYQPQENGVPCWFIQRIGKKFANPNDVDDSQGYLKKWKLIAPKSPIAGQTDFSKKVGFYYDGNTKIARPGECCTESFIVLGAFKTEKEVLSFKSYIFTKVVRFLLLQTVVSQDVTKKNYCFVPDLGKYNKNYTDADLCKLWNLSQDDWTFIDSKISNIGGDSNG